MKRKNSQTQYMNKILSTDIIKEIFPSAETIQDDL